MIRRERTARNDPHDTAMNKAFTKESDGDDDDDVSLPPLPGGGKNYMTPAGYAALRAELLQLIDDERPKIVEIVHWAASNGDRSENGDYIYGKKRLREIDRRIRFLTKRLESAEVVDPARQTRRDQVFFGATVTYANQRGEERTIIGVIGDERPVDPRVCRTCGREYYGLECPHCRDARMRLRGR